jgi:hypothetical protein
MMIYELRTYWAAPGKLGALINRFRNLTLNVFKRHQMEVVGFWTPDPATEESGDLVYILRFPDETAKINAWNAFRNDPDWIQGREASEKYGKLAIKVTSVTMHQVIFQ